MARELAAKSSRRIVLVVDIHPITCLGIKVMLQQTPDLVVCGQAVSIRDALEATDRLKPDLVITELQLGGESGVDLVKDIHLRYPDLPVLVLSVYDEVIYAERVLRAGARGYVTKEEAAENVLNAIRQVLDGQIVLSERMSAKMLSKLVGGCTESTGLSVDRLTDRELQIFELIGHGMSIRMIAETLHLSVKTIEAHRIRIKQKLQIDSATALLQQAIHWTQSQS